MSKARKSDNVILYNLRVLRSLLRPRQRRNALILIGMVLLGGVLDVLGLASIVPVVMTAMDDSFITEPGIMRSLYEALGFTEPNHFLIFLGILLLMISLIKNGYLIFLSYVQSRYAYNIALDLATRQFSNYFSKKLSFFKDTPSSSIVTNVVSIPLFFTNGVILPMLMLASEMVVSSIIILSILIFNPSLFLALALVLVPAFFLIYRSTRSRISRLGLQKEAVMPRVHGEMYQSIHGVQDIKIFAKTQVFLSRYLKEQFKLNETYRKSYILTMIPRQAMEVFAVMGVLAIFFFAIFTDSKSELALFISVFAAAAFRMVPSLSRMLASLMSIKNNQYTARILSELPELDEEIKETVPVKFEQGIELKALRFRYPENETDVLKGLNLKVQKGQCIGLMGESGSGKTTLLNLLLRFVEEQSGGLYVDDLKLEPRHTRAWRDQIGYVKQDVFILDGSILENVAFGEKEDEIDPERVQESLRMASMEDFMQDLPEGLHTQIGEKGGKLSGGQRQRIGIARALYGKAEVFVFDEATSALDSETEKMITESIERLKAAGKTVFIVAHRYTTLKPCDRIIEMAKGEILQEYQYDEIVGRITG